MQLAPQKVIILTGATAVGKTAVLQEIQQYLQENSQTDPDFQGKGLEVINCDSIQVYQHLDIASAKPSAQLRRQLPHHLVDILDPKEKFTAGYFVRQCDKLIPQIINRRNIPVICGGTVFYLKNFLYGLAEIPAVTGRYRSSLELLSLAELGVKLKALDFQSFQLLHPNDKQRLVRACEVSLETNKPFSAYKVSEKIRSQYQPLIIHLTLPRETLYQRIDQRVCQMFQEGLEQEFLRLEQLGYRAEDHGLQGIGYREFFELRQHFPSKTRDSQTRQWLIEKIQQNSRRYAKRQLTFLRQLPSQEYYSPSDSQQIAKQIVDFWREPPRALTLI